MSTIASRKTDPQKIVLQAADLLSEKGFHPHILLFNFVNNVPAHMLVGFLEGTKVILDLTDRSGGEWNL